MHNDDHEMPDPEILLQQACMVLDVLRDAGYTREVWSEEGHVFETLFLKYQSSDLTLQLEFADYRWRLEGVSINISVLGADGGQFGQAELDAVVPSLHEDLWSWLEDVAKHHLMRDTRDFLDQLQEKQTEKLLRWQEQQEADLARYRKLALETEEYPEGTIFLLPNTPEALGQDFWRLFPDHPTAEQQPHVWLVICGLGELIAPDHDSALDVLGRN